MRKVAAPRRPETPLEMQLALQIRAVGLPEPEWGVRWHPKRLWRADAGYRAIWLLIEVEGGVTPFRDKKGNLRQGRHNSILGYEGDCLKYSEAAILGWHVIRVTRRMLDDGRAIALIERAFRALAAAYGERSATGRPGA